jgi:hypothetical protein
MTDRLERVAPWLGALAALAAAAALFTRFGLDGMLSRDEAIYAYGGRQWADGVPFYVSTFDPKTPLSALLAAIGVLGGRVTGADELAAIRVAFGIVSCLAVLALYDLGRLLWDSVAAGLAAAVTLASFEGFAADAFGGPDAKTPGICMAIVAMGLLARRRWFWAALAGSCALLIWQPLAVFPLTAIAIGPCVVEAGSRGRVARSALAGTALPVALLALYYALEGALAQLWEGAVRFPITGLQRGPVTLRGRLYDIRHVVADGYPHTGVLFWTGCALLVAFLVARLVAGRSEWRRTVRDPLIWVVSPTFAGLVVFSLTDFQGYPDLFPLLPYAALGIGGGVAALGRPQLRRAGTAAAAAAIALLVVLCWHWYGTAAANDHELVAQRRYGAALNQLLGPRATLYSLGDPRPFVLTGRRSPSRFIYLGSGVGAWVVRNTPGGVDGWAARIRAARPAIIAFGGRWHGLIRDELESAVRRGYVVRYLDGCRLLVRPETVARADRLGLAYQLVPGRPAGEAAGCGPARGVVGASRAGTTPTAATSRQR